LEPRRGTTERRSAGVYVARAIGLLCLLLLGACPKSITDAGYNLTLSPPAATLLVADSTRLTATLRDPNGNLVSESFTWTVDNPSIATVDGRGVVRGVAPGSAVVRASARGLTASANVSVAEGGGTLTVSPATASVVVDASQPFTATLRDSQGNVISSTPEWSSTNTSVATVDGAGVARGKASGSATIQARVGTLVAGGTLSVRARASSGVLVGAGDIAACGISTDEATAALLDGISGTVFTAGDNAYPSGSATDYSSCYAPSWGRHKARTRPVPGNHEYETFGAGGYFGYFGAAAGDPATGYYSYEVGPWHIIALNSNVRMDAGSPQEQWLRADVKANSTKCTLAYWHHPRFSSGPHGSDASSQPLWQALYDAGADVVVSGHDHTYERFAPQTPVGKVDASRGLREFVVGTGGAGLYAWATIAANSEVRNNTTRGVLKLTLYVDRYEWQFVPVAGASFTDTGSASCH
jgi:hypothetical protein